MSGTDRGNWCDGARPDSQRRDGCDGEDLAERRPSRALAGVTRAMGCRARWGARSTDDGCRAKPAGAVAWPAWRRSSVVAFPTVTGERDRVWHSGREGETPNRAFGTIAVT